jgi:hypothetical protein
MIGLARAHRAISLSGSISLFFIVSFFLSLYHLCSLFFSQLSLQLFILSPLALLPQPRALSLPPFIYSVLCDPSLSLLWLLRFSLNSFLKCNVIYRLLKNIFLQHQAFTCYHCLDKHVTLLESMYLGPLSLYILAPEWRSDLMHCTSVLKTSLQTLVQFHTVSQPAVIGSHNWPSVFHHCN